MERYKKLTSCGSIFDISRVDLYTFRKSSLSDEHYSYGRKVRQNAVAIKMKLVSGLKEQ